MITSKWFRFLIAKIYNILRCVIARKLRHMCNLHIWETEISQKRSKGIWKIIYSVIFSVLSNKSNFNLGFSSPLIGFSNLIFIRNKDSENVAILYTTSPRTFQRSNVVSSVSRWATCGKFFEYLEALKSSKRSWTQFTLTQFIPRFLKTKPKQVIVVGHGHESPSPFSLLEVPNGWKSRLVMRLECIFCYIAYATSISSRSSCLYRGKFGVYCLLYTISHWNREREQKYIYL